MRFATKERLYRAELKGLCAQPVVFTDGPDDISHIERSYRSTTGAATLPIYLTVGREVRSVVVLDYRFIGSSSHVVGMVCKDLEDGTIVIVQHYDLLSRSGHGLMCD